ncbi:3-keto-5-aminohexanoate cleavage protein [Tumebacillus permanentifrigoris]|uniref:3-keto-5-aminohexanoate cleavage enzyme n=1 Tax=Tumebacillus permanentifrigoris TaxID=378543 RepID=A0A316DFI8_9BACL|nr:3-keto-5-aminohexanoate cleavage protein [Tumebacillus permanentifrigoris]PWK16312.1 3-keto-5-aminohexanoate cleavage enzyme [Tumebacillus permanentifrigoris]
MEKLIITVALVGAEVTREHQPNLPLSPDEIADAAYEAWKAGASIAHIHARDGAGGASQDRDIYQEIIAKIEAKCDIIVQVSTGGAVGMTPAERLQPVTLRPEMATLTVGTVNFGDDVFMNTPRDIETFAQAMLDHGVRPELEIFDVGMITNALRLLKKGLVREPLHFDFVLGVPGAIAGTVENLLHMVRSIPEGSTWSVAGVGRAQLPLNTMAILLGGHVRVGFEDNVYYEKGVLATSNAQFVERIVRLSKELGREVASPQEARKILGLSTVNVG